jgi:hypothetical protein
MNLTIRHNPWEYPEVIASYSAEDEPPAVKPCRPVNLIKTTRGFLVAGLAMQYEDRHKAIFISLILTISILLAIILAESNLIFISRSFLEHSFHEKYSKPLLILIPLTLFYPLVTKFLADITTFHFKGDKVIYHSTRRGYRFFPLKDLRFHVIKGEHPGDRYFLEIEIPEFTFRENLRMVIIEVAAQRETIDGMLAVLLPLMRGDEAPYHQATERCFVPIPGDVKPGLWRRYTNRESHWHVWFYNYKINQFLFWLVHGKKGEKIFAREKAKGLE